MTGHILFDKGIHLPELGLWLDPHSARDCAVVSHAHADHVKQHRRVIATPPTIAMMRLRGVVNCEFSSLPFRRCLEMPGGRVSLYPAGHILGSAQALVEWQDHRLLYSGDFKMRPGRSAEAVEVPAADTVIMETTFGVPRYRFPPTETVLEQVREFCRAALGTGHAPVLFCYSLGKGQELLAGLAGLDVPIYLHDAHWHMAALYRDFGVKLPPFQKFQVGQKLDGVLLCASGCRRAIWYGRLGKVRTAYLSGWAMDPRSAWRFRTDACFPLSDHADYEDLLEYVRLTGASRVYTVHGFADEFSADLRRRGLWSQPLRETPPQLSFPDFD